MRGSEINVNKKVLLRERKRHTAHRVASPWWGGGTYLGRGGGGTYLGWGDPSLARGALTLAGGYLPWLVVPILTRGVPTLAGGGVPTLAGRYLPLPG